MSEIAFHNGEFIPPDKLSVSVSDSGFVLGTTVSEQLRTFGGRLFQLDEHFSRLEDSLNIVGITTVDLAALKEDARRVVENNHAQLAQGDDLGLSIFITPGLPGPAGTISGPTVGMFTRPLPFSSWAEKYASGQKLGVSTVRQVPASCWPASLKCRSRMHYYLADREIQQRVPGARAVLLDQEGFVAEASTANLLMFSQGEGIVSPKPEKVLGGISVSVLKAIAADAGLPWSHRDITVEQLCAADEVFLCSTSPCLLPVTSIDGTSITGGNPGAVFQTLMASWSERVQTDIVGQAHRFQQRM